MQPWLAYNTSFKNITVQTPNFQTVVYVQVYFSYYINYFFSLNSLKQECDFVRFIFKKLNSILNL